MDYKMLPRAESISMIGAAFQSSDTYIICASEETFVPVIARVVESGLTGWTVHADNGSGTVLVTGDSGVAAYAALIADRNDGVGINCVILIPRSSDAASFLSADLGDVRADPAKDLIIATSDPDMAKVPSLLLAALQTVAPDVVGRLTAQLN